MTENYSDLPSFESMKTSRYQPMCRFMSRVPNEGHESKQKKRANRWRRQGRRMKQS